MISGLFRRTFSSLKYRNYRLFFFGQLISLIGTWMQWTAQQWLVYKITNSKLLLGAIAACGSMPMLLFSIFGGMAADRYAKRTILLITQTVMMITALILGILVMTGHVMVWHIALLAAVSGVAAAFDMPTRQAFVIEMVEGKDNLMNAIGLNSSIFNGARIVGPAVAGIIMADLDIGWCFMLNSLSFIAVIIGLGLMKFKSRGTDRRKKSFLGEVKDGFLYAYSQKEIFWLLVMVSVAGIFGWSYVTLIPAFARDVLSVGEKGYGFMLTAGGIGALIGALSVATLEKASYSRITTILGMIVFSVFASIFSFTKNYNISLLVYAVSLYGITAFFASANTFIQISVPDDIRGRIMGIWTFVFGGMMPIGSLQIGYMGEKFGPGIAVFIGAVICLLSIITLSAYYLFRLRRASIA